jgi:hypothetical protein
MLYHYTPLLEAGLITPSLIVESETFLQKKFMKLPNRSENCLIKKNQDGIAEMSPKI